MKNLLIFIFFFIIAILISCQNSTLEVMDRPMTTGSVEASIEVSKIGSIGKQLNLMDIVMDSLYIQLSAPGEDTIFDTIKITSGLPWTFNKTYNHLRVNKLWTLHAFAIDTNDSITHSGDTTFTVAPNSINHIYLSLPCKYSELMAYFYPIRDSVTECRLLVDNAIVDNSIFEKQTRIDDTVGLTFDYLTASVFPGTSHNIKLDVFGDWNGLNMLLYSGDTTINVISGDTSIYDLQLRWVGPDSAQCSITVVLGNIGNTIINGFIDTMIIETGIDTGTVFFENFENGWGDWDVTNGIWEIGTTSTGPDSAISGDSVAGTVLAGNYPNNNSTLISPEIQLPAIGVDEEIHLRFWHWFSFSGIDVGEVWIREQLPSGEWSESIKLTTFSLTGGGIWTYTLADLSAYSGKKVKLQFQLVGTNYHGNSFGWYIDDILIKTSKIILLNPTDTYFENFEDGYGNWWVANGTWEIGQPSSGPDTAFSGSNVAGTVLAENYPNNNSGVISSSIQLPAINEDEVIQLTFYHWFSFSGTDLGKTWIREQLPSGEWSEWILLRSFSGSSGGAYTRPLFDISVYSGKKVKLQFQLVGTNYHGNSFGWYIDDVSISVKQ